LTICIVVTSNLVLINRQRYNIIFIDSNRMLWLAISALA
jgi:hypothetical protein